MVAVTGLNPHLSVIVLQGKEIVLRLFGLPAAAAARCADGGSGLSTSGQR